MPSDTDILIQVSTELDKALNDLQNLEKNIKQSQSAVNNQLSPAVNNTSTKITNMGNKVSQAGMKIKNAIGTETALAFTALGASVTAFTKKCVDAAIKSESEWSRFGALVNQNGGNWGKQKTEIKGWAVEFSNRMGYATSDTREASMAFLQLGMNVAQMEDAMNATAGVAARAGITEAEASSVVSQALLGKGRQLEKLTGLRIDDYKTADGQIDRERLLNDLYKQNEDAINAHANTTEAQIARINNSWGSFKAQIGTALLPVVKIVADVVSKVVQWFAKLDPGVKSVIAVVLAITGVVMGAIGVLGMIAPVLINIGTLITAVGEAWGVIAFLTPLFAPIIGVLSSLIVPILAVVAAFTALYFIGQQMGWWNDLGGMISKFGEVLGQVIGVLSEFVGWFTKLFTDFPAAQAQFRDFVNNIGSQAAEALGGAWDSIVSAAGGLASALSQMFWDAVDGAKNSIMQSLGNIRNIISDALSNLGASVVPGGGLTEGILALVAPLPTLLYGVFQRLAPIVLPAVNQFITDTVNRFNDWGNSVWNNFTSQISALGTNIYNGILDMANTAVQSVSTFINNFVNAFAGIREEIITTVSTALSNVGTIIWNGLMSYLSFAANFRNQVIQYVLSIFTSLVTTIQTWLAQAQIIVGMLVTMLVNNIVQRFNMLVMNVRNIFTNITNAIRQRLENARLIASNMANLIRQTIVNRFTQIIARTRQIFQNIINTIRQRLQSAVSTARTQAVAIYNAIVQKVQEIPGKIGQEVGKLKDIIRDKLVAAAKQMFSSAQSLVSNFLNGIQAHSPGKIQRTWFSEMSSLASITTRQGAIAAKSVGNMAGNIVNAWDENMQTLTIPVDKVEEIILNPLADAIKEKYTSDINMTNTLPEQDINLLSRDFEQENRDMQRVTSNVNNTQQVHKTLIIHEIRNELANLTTQQSKEVVWRAIGGLYDRM